VRDGWLQMREMGDHVRDGVAKTETELTGQMQMREMGGQVRETGG
jgi:hypothetical protein